MSKSSASVGPMETEHRQTEAYREIYGSSTADSTPNIRGCNTGNAALSSSTSTLPACTDYQSYSRRWFILASVFMVTLSNYAHWIAFASVQSKAAEFYRVNEEEAKRICTVSYGLGIPCCILATVIVSKRGLRTGLYVGAFFTALGGLLCFLSSLPGITEATPPTLWYWMAVVGQALTGIGSPFVACVPTKVSQNWFNERQRAIATTVLGLSNPIGLFLGQSLTPLLTSTVDRIPIMNTVWFAVALVGSIMVFASTNRSLPPTPPSRSAALEAGRQGRTRYWATIKAIMTNKSFLVLAFVVGGAMAYLSAQQVSNEPVLCSLGYSNSYSGLSAGLVFLGGIVGSIVCGLLFNACPRLKARAILVSKALMFPLAGVMVALVFLLQMSSMEIPIALAYAAAGFLAIGMYPTLLEFAVEATYPNDEAVVVAIIMVCSAVQGVIILELQGPLTKEYDWKTGNLKETCTQSAASLIQPKDHTPYVCFLSAYTTFLILIYFLFFRTKFNRTAANRGENVERL